MITFQEKIFSDYFAIVYLQLELPTCSLKQFELPIELLSSKFISLLVNIHVMYIVALALLSDNLNIVSRGQPWPAGLAILHKKPGEISTNSYRFIKTFTQPVATPVSGLGSHNSQPGTFACQTVTRAALELHGTSKT